MLRSTDAPKPDEAPAPTLGELRALLDAAHDAVVAMDSRGVISEWNDAATHLFGWSRSQALGLPMLELLVPARLRDAHRRGMEVHRRTGRTTVIGRRVEVPALRRDGSEVRVELTVSVATIRGERGFFAVLHDVTSRSELDAVRRRSSLVVASTQDAVVTCAVDGTIRSWNAGAARLFGLGAGEAIGSPVAVLGLDEELTPWRAHLERGSSRPVQRATTGVDRSGRVLDLLATAVPLPGPGPDEGADVLLVLRDVSALVRAEADLREARERFDDAFEASPIGMAVLDATGRVVVANDALGGLLGQDADLLAGRPLDAAARTDDGRRMHAALRRVAGGAPESEELDVVLREREEPTRVVLTATRRAETGEVGGVVAQLQHPAPAGEVVVLDA